MPEIARICNTFYDGSGSHILTFNSQVTPLHAMIGMTLAKVAYVLATLLHIYYLPKGKDSIN